MTVLEPGTTFAGKYLIDGVLGKGGMGAVYSATNQAIGRRVAIKVLVADLADRDDMKKRFELEARAAAVINHPGIVDVLDMGETSDGEPFIVMEHLEGATLKAVFKKHGVLTPAQAVGVIAPLLDALSAAHQAAVIHRDIKPANIFLVTKPQSVVKLLDFGISRFGQSTGLTGTGTAVGTPKYMAPEQVMGEELGPGADIYSVGAVLYELLGGRAPYDADSDIATLAKMLKEMHSPLKDVRPDLPMRLCAFVDSLLTKEAERRPSDARKVRDSMLAIQPAGDLSALFELAALPRGSTPKPPRNPTSPGRRAPTSSKLAAIDPEVEAAAGRPTTVSRRPKTPAPSAQPASSADALEPAEARPSKTGVLVGIGIGAVALLAAAGFLWFKSEPPSNDAAVVAPRVVKAKPAPMVEPGAPANEPASLVVVTLKAVPPTASFELDGEKLEGNPATLERDKGTGASVIASAPGFEPQVVRVSFAENHEEVVTLTRLTAQAPEEKPEPRLETKPEPRTPRSGSKQGGTQSANKKKLTVDETNPYE